ncbi:MAG: hypothetical protein V2I40_09010 [Desulfobacteraceae bacterium]|nr:hypothetical protein [Desulfobacteraceae bacterium]
MKKLVIAILMMVIGIPGCSVQPVGSGNSRGVGVMFDGEPLIVDASVIFLGIVVGQILSHETGNGVTRVSIALDSQYDDLKKNNLAAVVKNGRLHLSTFSGYGDPLPPGGYINGFINTTSYRWFKLRHLINNINISADRRAQRLLVRSGWAG